MNQPEAARRARIEHNLLNMEREQPNTKAYEAMGEPRHMTAFWDVGLCELSDFTDFLGTRMMTYPTNKWSVPTVGEPVETDGNTVPIVFHMVSHDNLAETRKCRFSLTNTQLYMVYK